MDWMVYALLGCLALFVILVGAWVYLIFLSMRDESED